MRYSVLTVHFALGLQFASALPVAWHNSGLNFRARHQTRRGVIPTPLAREGPHEKVGSEGGADFGEMVGGPVLADIIGVVGAELGHQADVLDPNDSRPAPVLKDEKSYAKEAEDGGAYIAGAILEGLAGDTGLQLGEMVGKASGKVFAAIADDVAGEEEAKGT
ncbi:hypothetical protein C8R43DRAFT_1110019 [Mycena crocata]|nr:hypothetical protein C8R43DRAFT_1110019 [Mycena crocata]